MQVEISTEVKFSKIDNFFVLLSQEATKNLPAGIPREIRGKIEKAISEARFTGRPDEGITVLGGEPRKITLVGLGPASSLTHRTARAAMFGVAKIAKRNRDSSIAVAFPYLLPGLDDRETARHVADLLIHSDYRYDVYQAKKEDEQSPSIRCSLLADPEIDGKTAKRLTREATAIADAVRTVRDLGNGPANQITPTRLAERAEEIARAAGVKCTVYDRKQITKMGMGGLLAVNRGAIEEPRFIVLEYTPRKAGKTVCLVGKGITFDSGGISIKPSEKMEEMKFDMCGAAAVIGTIQAAASLQIPHCVIGLIPTTENLPSGSAYKPGDIITMMSGKTVEIVNTDAEGRMILADALFFASRFKPDHLIDYATLTGACVVALGSEATGLFSTDDDLAQKLIESGDRAGERLWRMPVWEEYRELIRSEWADMKNSGGRWGGAISAALFLKEFVNCPSWAHLDIAGTAAAEHETAREPRGATGVGVRGTINFLEGLS